MVETILATALICLTSLGSISPSPSDVPPNNQDTPPLGAAITSTLVLIDNTSYQALRSSDYSITSFDVTSGVSSAYPGQYTSQNFAWLAGNEGAGFVDVVYSVDFRMVVPTDGEYVTQDSTRLYQVTKVNMLHITANYRQLFYDYWERWGIFWLLEHQESSSNSFGVISNAMQAVNGLYNSGSGSISSSTIYPYSSMPSWVQKDNSYNWVRGLGYSRLTLNAGYSGSMSLSRVNLFEVCETYINGVGRAVNAFVGSTNTNVNYNNGYNVGYAEGKTAGVELGQSEGYQSGYNVGYNAGQQSVTDETAAVFNLFGAVASVPISILNGLGGFTIWNVSVIAIAVTFLFIGLILWIIRRFI